MPDVTRYRMAFNETDGVWEVSEPDGEWVKWEDCERVLGILRRMYESDGESSEAFSAAHALFYGGEPETADAPSYDAEFAIHLARCWRDGKMIGGDEEAVRDALLAEVEELRAFKQAVLDPENQPSQFGTVLIG